MLPGTGRRAALRALIRRVLLDDAVSQVVRHEGSTAVGAKLIEDNALLSSQIFRREMSWGFSGQRWELCQEREDNLLQPCCHATAAAVQHLDTKR